MNELLYFLFGVIFILAVLPILQSITDFMATWLEVKKSAMSVIIVKNSCEIEKMKIELEPISTQAIGFHSDEEYLECEDDEEDCSDKQKFNKKIGFWGSYERK